MRFLMIICVVLSTVFISCAKTPSAQTQISSGQAPSVVETIKILGQVDESLQAGLSAQVVHHTGL